MTPTDEIAIPQTQCPKCGDWLDDLDGFGVLRHAACGYCAHPSGTVLNDGSEQCDVCGLIIPAKVVKKTRKNTTSWKGFERRIAKLFNGQRRGAYTGNGRQGKTDIIATGWAIECKLYGRPNYSTLLEAAHQAERNAEKATDIPIAIAKRKNDHDRNALVVMRLETFLDHFGPTPTSDTP